MHHSTLRTTMDGCVDEIVHTISLGEFESNKRCKEQVLQGLIAATCAMLNSNGGKVVIQIKPVSDDRRTSAAEGSSSCQVSLVVRILEQRMTSIIGSHQTVSKMNFKKHQYGIVIFIKKADSLITTSYNLYFPSEAHVLQISPWEPLENVKDDIINRKVVLEPDQLGSHYQQFHKDKNSAIQESKKVQLKNVKADPSKRTTLADRMTGKGNKFSCYVSAFANYNGGHIYYGIRDDGVVEGELIPNENDKNEIIKKVEKVINKMIWPEHIGQPKRGEDWDIFFQPVLDGKSKPIPSTFVIVIHICRLLLGRK